MNPPPEKLVSSTYPGGGAIGTFVLCPGNWFPGAGVGAGVGCGVGVGPEGQGHGTKIGCGVAVGVAATAPCDISLGMFVSVVSRPSTETTCVWRSVGIAGALAGNIATRPDASRTACSLVAKYRFAVTTGPSASTIDAPSRSGATWNPADASTLLM